MLRREPEIPGFQERRKHKKVKRDVRRLRGMPERFLKSGVSINLRCLWNSIL